MAEVTRLPGTAGLDEVLTVIRRDGGVIVEDMVDAAVLQELRDDLLPHLAERNTGTNGFMGRHTRRMSALFAKSRRVADVITHPLFLGAAEELVNVPVRYWSGEQEMVLRPGLRIGATQVIDIGPGESAQRLHRDDWSFLWQHPQFGREARLQLMLALSDFTAENGGTLVIPGSHTWHDERVPQLAEAVSTEMKAGSALFWVGSLYHAGGANRTADQWRTGLTMTLDAANVRQEENMYLALPTDVVKSYPEEIQRLLGWAAGPTYMGWVEIDGELADPIRLVR